MEDILKLIESYGLTLILLLGSLYALYKFFFFSIREVKGEFSKRHETLAQKMEEVKEELNDLKAKVDIILEFIRRK